jgi:hypothetical protein
MFSRAEAGELKSGQLNHWEAVIPTRAGQLRCFVCTVRLRDGLIARNEVSSPAASCSSR